MKSSSITGWSTLSIALVLAGGGGYVAAQGKTAPAPAARPATGTPRAMKAEMSCPMHDAAQVADVTAENTSDGAVIRLKAKKPADVQRIQQLASMTVEHLTSGGMEHCGMMHDGMMHGGMHGKGSTGGDRRVKVGPPEATPKPAQPNNPHKH